MDLLEKNPPLNITFFMVQLPFSGSFRIPGFQKPVSRKSTRLLGVIVVLFLTGAAFSFEKLNAADAVKETKSATHKAALSTVTALSDASLERIAKSGIRLTGTQAFSSRQLRGFGTVKGVAYLWEREGMHGSLLTVACENEEKAKLLHAKYLSDISVLPGVEDRHQKLGDQDVPVKMVKTQGTILALRSGACVRIFAASTDALLEELVKAIKPTAPFLATPEVEVPMYLDVWDRFSLRFYDVVGRGPEGEKGRNYDPQQELKWAEKIGRAGLVLWTGCAPLDLASGLTDEPSWDWVLREATARKLPIGLNLANFGTSAFPLWMKDQFQQHMPEFSGNQYAIGDVYHAGQGTRLSWCADEGLDYAFGPIQKIVRNHVDNPSVAFYLEPHSEIRHREWDILMEYGSVADRSYRKFLQEKYQTPKAVSQRWYGDRKTLKGWSDVRVPEVASFQGWESDSLDLTGTWRICFEPKDSQPGATSGSNGRLTPDSTVPVTWAAPAFDDSQWATLTAPGADRWYLLPKTAAVYRRHFQVPEAWMQKKPVWLYVWDLNQSDGKQTVGVYLNGKQIDLDSTRNGMSGHVGRYDVAALLTPGDNQLTLRLPMGYLAYRTYLSHTPPPTYPSPDNHYNARWADFIDWYSWTRGEAVRRGIEAIRAADPNRPIEIASPGSFAESLRPLCEQYGAFFYDTGGMSGTWIDILPMLMRGVDMPMALEPGSPPHEMLSLKSFLGLWGTEGIQANNYFMHIGDLFYRDDLRPFFEQQLPLTRLTGKYHAPKGEVAMLTNTQGVMATGFPMPFDANVCLGGGYWGAGHGQFPTDRWHFDALLPSDFAAGNAAPYKVIVDTNTSIMDPSIVSAIEKWVREGGVFVTRIQTGRHTPEQADAWPISRLTGYRVTHLDKVSPTGGNTLHRYLRLAPGQSVFPADAWDPKKNFSQGQTLQKEAPECQDLLLWADGGVAAGVRPLGKGMVVNLGLNGGTVPDLVSKILEWRKLTPMPIGATPDSRTSGVRPFHFQSNNGLYDVCRVWNQKREPSPAINLRLANLNTKPEFCLDPLSGKFLTLEEVDGGWGIKNLSFGPLEQQAYLTPRNQIEHAPLEWFGLQRNWWRGTTPPRRKTPLPLFTDNTVDLNDRWSFIALDDNADAKPLATTGYDDSKCERMPLGVWDFPNHHDVKRAMYRKSFTVPTGWTNGAIYFWLQIIIGDPIVGKGQVYLDGEPLTDGARNGGFELTSRLTPGSKHTLALDIRKTGALGGVRGNAWLSYFPEPDKKIDLAGTWQTTVDGLKYGGQATLPGKWNGWRAARRSIQIPQSESDKSVFIQYEGLNSLIGVLVNGTYVRRHHHGVGGITRLNITPYLRFGQDNEIEIVGVGTGDLTSAALWLYKSPK